jgi:hypothetical protein
MIDWIPISEKPPEHISILIYDKREDILHNVRAGSYTRQEGFQYWSGSSCNLDEEDSQETITHWAQINKPEVKAVKLPGKDVKKNYEHNSLPYELADILIERVKSHTNYLQRYVGVPGAFEIIKQNSAHEIAKVLKEEKNDNLVLEVFEFALEDEFWRDNIRSGNKFRLQFPKLLQQMENRVPMKVGEDEDRATTMKLVGIYRALIDNPKYFPPEELYYKFYQARKRLEDFFSPRNIIVHNGIEYLLSCLQKNYGDRDMTIYPGHLNSDHTWEVLMPQYMREIGL